MLFEMFSSPLIWPQKGDVFAGLLASSYRTEVPESLMYLLRRSRPPSHLPEAAATRGKEADCISFWQGRFLQYPWAFHTQAFLLKKNFFLIVRC